MSLDLLLVTPSSRMAVYQGLGSEIAAIEPPVWSGLIATYIRNKGHSVEMLDAEALGLTHEETAKRILEKDPKLTVFVIYGQQPSASTQCMPSGRKTCQFLKHENPLSLTAVMGTHASALPEKTLSEEPYDFVVMGEGPITVLRLLEEVKFNRRSFKDVPGLCFWDDGIVLATKWPEKIKDLDQELPEQAWDLLDMSLYRAHNWHALGLERKPYASIQTSLGCPYKCSFCCINAPFGGSGIRYWSPENIVGQIDKLTAIFGTTTINIKIPDEMFVLNEKHVLGICDGLIGRNYNLNIWAYARVDTVKESFLKKLKAAGFNWLCLGIESGSKHVRDGVSKGRFGDTDIELVVKKIRDEGINVIGNYIFGLPDDTYESMQETFDLAERLNTEWANFYSAMAYPGSKLYQMALEKGWPLPTDWGGYSQHAYDTFPLPTETLTGPQVLAFRDKMTQAYFKNEKYRDLIRQKFGAQALVEIERTYSKEIKRIYT